MKTARHTPWYQRPRFWWPTGVITGLIVGLTLFWLYNPWPSILLVRAVFSKSDHNSRQNLEKHTPGMAITLTANQQYEAGNRRALLDVYTPASTAKDQTLPVVIWTHGGAWVSGDKSAAAPYFKLLAAQGFAVVSVNYTLAPAKKYPAQLFELNKAHAYLVANAARLHINPDKVFLAGDSAGAHLSAQLAALITNPDYAREVGIHPSLKPSQLAGTALFCGIYKVEKLVEVAPNVPKILSWGDDQVVWAFSGTRQKTGPLLQQMSPYYHVTKDFPPTFISGGNGDPLTDHQSKPLAEKLQHDGVSVQTLFYASDHQPSLPHEYQFNLDNGDGQTALKQLIQFLQARAL